MWTFLVVSALALASNVWCQDCSGPPRFNVFPFDCCTNMPCIMTPELAAECGLSKPGEGGPRGPPSCENILCPLRKNNLLSGDKINRSALKAYLESKSSAEWLPIIDRVTQQCNSEVSASVTDCEPMQYMNCFKDKIFLSCPTSAFTPTDACNNLKAHIQNCPKPNGPMG